MGFYSHGQGIAMDVLCQDGMGGSDTFTPCPQEYFNPRCLSFFMNVKNIAIAGLTGGTLLFVLLFGLNVIMNQIISYDISEFGGMRPMDDPVMLLFFAYPFVVAFAAAYLYDILHPLLQGSVIQKGTAFGLILLVIVAIPSNFAMYTSMDWPVSFYIGNLIWATAGFVAMGILFARIWNT